MTEIMGILAALKIDHTLFYQFTIFAVSFFIIRHLGFSPYVKALHAREEKTKGNQSQAEQIYVQTRELEMIYQRKARALTADIKSIYDNARAEGLTEQDRIIAEAKNRTKLSIESAREKIQEEFNKAREDLIKDAPLIGKTISEKLVGRSL